MVSCETAIHHSDRSCMQRPREEAIPVTDMYSLVKLNMFFGSLLRVEDAKAIYDID